MTDVAQTREAVRGRSDAEILSWIASVGGTEAFLEEAFVGLRDAFQPDRAKDRKAVIEWDVNTPDGVKSYHVVVNHGECSVARGEHPGAGVTLEIDVANFLRLLVGQLDGRDAVEAGTLGISGDRTLARTIRDWFRETH